MRTKCYGLSQQNNAVYNRKYGRDMSSCHIWTREVEQRSPETSHCICPNLTTACFYDIRRCAHMTASAQRLEHCTGKSLHSVRGPGPLNQLHASWVSLNYITYMKTWYILYLHMSSNTLSLQQNKEPRHNRNCNAISGSGAWINPTLICRSFSWLMCNSAAHSECNWLEDRIIQLNAWIMWVTTLKYNEKLWNILRNPSCVAALPVLLHCQEEARQRGGSPGLGSLQSWPGQSLALSSCMVPVVYLACFQNASITSLCAHLRHWIPHIIALVGSNLSCILPPFSPELWASSWQNGSSPTNPTCHKHAQCMWQRGETSQGKAPIEYFYWK